MAEHRKVCPEETVKCSMCPKSFKRSELEAHLHDPQAVTTHLLSLQTTIEELRSENQCLKRRVAVATSRDREALVEALGNVYKITPISATHPLAKAIKTVIGAEEWGRIVKDNLKVHEAIVGLLDFLSSNPNEMGESCGWIVGAAAEALDKLSKWKEEDESYGYEWEDPWKALESVGACGAVVKALIAYPTNEKAQSQGWWAVLGLFDKDLDFKRQALFAMAFKGVAAAMLAFPSNRDLQLVGCEVLRILSIIADDVDGKELSESGCKAVVAALHAFPADLKLQEVSVSAIYRCAMVEEFEELWEELNAAAVVIKAMRSFPNQQKVQQKGCSALINLAIYGSRAEIGKEGGCEAVVAAMEAFPHCDEVQESGCWALNNLLGVSRRCEDNRVRIANAGGCQVIVKALKAMPLAREVHHRGNMAIGKLVRAGGSARLVVELGGIEAILKGMKEHIKDADSVGSACSSLASIASSENATLVAESGVIEAILKGMKEHIKDAELVGSMCSGLASIVGEYTGDRAKLMEVEVLEAVAEGMVANIDDVETVETVCRDLGSLLKCYGGDKGKLVETGVLEAVVQVIKEYDDYGTLMEGSSSAV